MRARTASAMKGRRNRRMGPDSPSAPRIPVPTRPRLLLDDCPLFDHSYDVAGADRVPGLDPDLGHGARLLGTDVVLHLHGFEHAHRLAGRHRVALGHEDLDD